MADEFIAGAAEGASDTSWSDSVGEAFTDTTSIDDSTDTAEESDVVEEPEVEPEPEIEAEEESPVEAAPAEENEDYAIREKNGKKELVFKESRGRMIYDTYKTAQAVEQVFGEPLTPELAQERQAAFIDREAMIADFFTQGKEQNVLGFLADLAENGKESGEIGHDPMVNLAAKFPAFLKSNPEAYNALQRPVLEATFGGLKALAREAKAKGDDGLLLSLPWVEKALFGQYTPTEQVLAAPSEIDAREKALNEREQRLQDQDNQVRVRDYNTWSTGARAEIDSKRVSAITAVLEPVAKAYEAFPHEWQALQDSLHNELKSALRKDAEWQSTLRRAEIRAQNAVSPSIRDGVKADLARRAEAKAKYLLDPVRNTKVKDIIASRATQVKAQSDAKHKRLETGAARREPGSTGSPAPQRVSTGLPNGATGKNAWKAAVASAFE